MFQGIMGSKAASHNSSMLTRQAALRREKGEFDARAAETKYERFRGQTVASIGATGLSIASMGDILADSVMESQLEVNAIRWGARNESDNLLTQASGERAKGQAALIGGVFGAIGAGAKGFGNAMAMAPAGGSYTVGTGEWAATVNPSFRG